MKTEKQVSVNGRMYTFRQLSEVSGYDPRTLRKRAANGVEGAELLRDQQKKAQPPPKSTLRRDAEQAKREQLRAQINQLVRA